MDMPKFASFLLSVLTVIAASTAASAQQKDAPSAGWQTGVRSGSPAATTVPRAGASEAPAVPQPGVTNVKLEALLTDDGQRIEQGLVWRIFNSRLEADGKPKLIATHREAAPTLKVAPGDYTVNVAFGRANLTRKITAKPAEAITEKFVLNAGGLRVAADIGGIEAPSNAVTYTIQSDERDQFGNRAAIMTGAKPGLIIRLNAGIYQLTSTYGDANAIVRTDVTVEAGKLTEAAVSHLAAKVAFKLVAEPGGDAVPDTQWSIQTMTGEIVKESVGAFPTHILAPGTYAAIAKKSGKSYRRDFLVRQGDTVQVEVIIQ
jgi:hypothetical protein